MAVLRSPLRVRRYQDQRLYFSLKKIESGRFLWRQISKESARCTESLAGHPFKMQGGDGTGRQACQCRVSTVMQRSRHRVRLSINDEFISIF